MITQMLHSSTMFHVHTIQQMKAQEILMVSNQVNQRWFKGPSLLNQPEDQWPNQVSAEVSKGNPKVKPPAAGNVIAIKQDLLSQLERKISSWEKMEKAVAHILTLKCQLLQNIKQKNAILTSNMKLTALINVECYKRQVMALSNRFKQNTLKMGLVS